MSSPIRTGSGITTPIGITSAPRNRQQPIGDRSTTGRLGGTRTLKRRPPPAAQAVAGSNAKRLTTGYTGFKNSKGVTNPGYRAAKVAALSGGGRNNRVKTWLAMPLASRTNVARRYNSLLKTRAQELGLKRDGKVAQPKQLQEYAKKAFLQAFEDERKNRPFPLQSRTSAEPSIRDGSAPKTTGNRSTTYAPPGITPFHTFTDSPDERRRTKKTAPQSFEMQEFGVPENSPQRTSPDRGSRVEELQQSEPTPSTGNTGAGSKEEDSSSEVQRPPPKPRKSSRWDVANDPSRITVLSDVLDGDDTGRTGDLPGKPSVFARLGSSISSGWKRLTSSGGKSNKGADLHQQMLTTRSEIRDLQKETDKLAGSLRQSLGDRRSSQFKDHTERKLALANKYAARYMPGKSGFRAAKNRTGLKPSQETQEAYKQIFRDDLEKHVRADPFRTMTPQALQKLAAVALIKADNQVKLGMLHQL